MDFKIIGIPQKEQEDIHLVLETMKTAGGKCFLILLVAVMVKISVGERGFNALDAGAEGGALVVVRHVVEEWLSQCHVVVFPAYYQDEVMDPLIRFLGTRLYLASVVIDLEQLQQEPPSVESALLQELRESDDLFTCRALLINLDPARSIESVFRFLEGAELYKWPDTYVVLLGSREDVVTILLHPTFRNTINILYVTHEQYQNTNLFPLPMKHHTTQSFFIAKRNRETPLTHHLGLFKTPTPLPSLMNSTHSVSSSLLTHSALVDEYSSVSPALVRFPREVSNSLRNAAEEQEETRVVHLYTRCFYCDGGRPNVVHLDTWTPVRGFQKKALLFPDNKFQDFMGHKFRVVSMNWFPFIEFDRTSEEGGTIVHPRDSLDLRMLNSIAKLLNFTYEMRVPWDNQWGTSTPNGNWTGIVGTLQHHKGDFSMMLSWMPNRLPHVDYSRIYASEPLVMVTSKPLPLNQAFALIRPFSGELWVMTVVSVLIAGVVLWAQQWVRSRFVDGKAFEFSRSMLAMWQILLEDPPNTIPDNVSAQMLLGWWWVYCMIVTIMYRSSLMAHLIIPGKSPTLDSLDDLLEANKEVSWTWGYEPTYGSGWEWLKINESPTVKEIFKKILVLEFDEQISRVLEGHHAFITWKYYIKSIIASRYTDARGYTPIHTAKEDFFNYGGYGWGFRKGAPFRRRIDVLKQRLIESGSIPFWLDDLIITTARNARIQRQERQEDEKETQGTSTGKEGYQVVLSLGHLQGVFYLLLLGQGFAFIVFLTECLLYKRNSYNESVLHSPSSLKPCLEDQGDD